MKIVLNKCFGGFGLSNDAYKWLIKNKGWKVTTYNKSGSGYKNPKAQLVKSKSDLMEIEYYLVNDKDEIEFRTSKDLIAVVEALNGKASGKYAELEIIEVPDNAVDLYIDEYDGVETLREGRSW